MKQPLLLFISLSFMFSNGATDFTSDIIKYTSKLSALNKAGVDPIDGLKCVADTSKALLSLGERVGALIAVAVDQTFDPNSDEQSAIENISNYMNTQFKDVNMHNGDDVVNDPEWDRIRAEYSTKVQVRLANTWRAFLRVILPNETRIGFKRGFLIQCQENNPPKEVLGYIYEKFYKNCGALPTEEGLKRSIQAQKAFQKIENSLDKLPSYLQFEEYYEIKWKLTKLIRISSQSVANSILKKLESVKARSPRELESRFEELGLMKDFVSSIKDCFLDIAFEANEHKRSVANGILQELSFDILKAQVVFSACNNVSNEGNATAMKIDRKEAGDMVELMGNYIVDYMNNSLHLDWPTYTLEAVKTTFGSQTFDFSQYAEKVAEIGRHVENYGPNNKGYQVVLTEHNEDLEHMVRTIDDSRYAKIIGMNGVNVHIFQYDLDEPDRVRNASEWFQVHYNEMAKELVEHTKIDLQQMTSRFVEDYKILDASRFNSLLILRKKAFWEPNSIIHSAVAPVPSYNGTSQILYCHNKWYEFAYCWHVYAFL